MGVPVKSIMAELSEQTVPDEETAAVGSGLIVTVPVALVLGQFVVVSVIVTLYEPARLVTKDTTFPGSVAPDGTDQE